MFPHLQPSYNSRRHSAAQAFTLIELLIVALIVSILAAIAVPNFLEFQTRAKVSRVKSDLRTLATGIEAYRVDNAKYPEGTDNPAKYDPRIADFLGELAPGYYTLRTRGGGIAGSDFFTLTTPIAYVSRFFTDPFAGSGSGFLTYCYRPAKDRANGYILTSFGPDHDAFQSVNGKLGSGTGNQQSPFSTQNDGKTPARLGDINERAVIHYIEGTQPALIEAVDQNGGLRQSLEQLRYDPTNGTVSDGDIYRLGPGQ